MGQRCSAELSTAPAMYSMPLRTPPLQVQPCLAPTALLIPSPSRLQRLIKMFDVALSADTLVTDDLICAFSSRGLARTMYTGDDKL